jgi:hypothetical protein
MFLELSLYLLVDGSPIQLVLFEFPLRQCLIGCKHFLDLGSGVRRSAGIGVAIPRCDGFYSINMTCKLFVGPFFFTNRVIGYQSFHQIGDGPNFNT